MYIINSRRSLSPHKRLHREQLAVLVAIHADHRVKQAVDGQLPPRDGVGDRIDQEWHVVIDDGDPHSPPSGFAAGGFDRDRDFAALPLRADAGRNSAASCSVVERQPWVSPGSAFCVSALRMDETSGLARRIWAVMKSIGSAEVRCPRPIDLPLRKRTTPPCPSVVSKGGQRPARLIAFSTIASSSTTATGSTPPSARRRASTSANSESAGTVSSAMGAAARNLRLGRLGLGVGLRLRTLRLALSCNERLEAARLAFDEFQELALPDVLPASVGKRCGEFRQACLVVVHAEDELHDRSHRSAGLGLHAQFLEQLGIILRLPLRSQCEVERMREGSIECGAAAAVRRFHRIGGLARGPQPVGKAGIVVERDFGGAARRTPGR